MGAIIKQIEKGKPFFEKISRNIYLGAIRDGFLAAMPAILFSSIFLLIAAVPEVFNFIGQKMYLLGFGKFIIILWVLLVYLFQLQQLDV